MGLPGAKRIRNRSQTAEPEGIKSSADEQTARAERIEMRSQKAEPVGINLIRGRRDGTSWHNTAIAKPGRPTNVKPDHKARRDKFLHSVLEVNEAVGWRRFSFLPGEISTARNRESGSAVRRNALGDGREVSRGHSTTFVNRGDERCPINCDTRKREHGKGRTDTMGRPGHPPTTLSPALVVGARSGNRSRAEKESPCVSVAVPQGEAAHVCHPRLG